MSSNLLRNDSSVLCSTVLTILSARNDLPDDSSLLCSTVLTILSARNLLPDDSSLLCSTVLTILSARNDLSSNLLPDDAFMLCSTVLTVQARRDRLVNGCLRLPLVCPFGSVLGVPTMLTILLLRKDMSMGAGIACWLQRQTRDRKLASSNPAEAAGEFSSPESTLCADSYLVSVPLPCFRSGTQKIPDIQPKGQVTGYT